MAVKKKETENLTETNIEKVISLLEQQKPITKKEACEILNISYNTTRLSKIIEEYRADKALTAKRRAANKGKVASPSEIVNVIEQYLEGDPVSEIAKRLYRSAAFVNSIIEEVGVPQRGVGENYFEFSPLPEQCIADSFEIGEKVWSCRYQAIAVIDKTEKSKDYNVYTVKIYEEFEEISPYFPNITRGFFYASQPAHELGSLKHLVQYGLNLNKK